MKIMIDISEKTYNEIMDDAKNTPRNLNYYERIIADGNPIDFGNVSSRQAVLDALCDECELFYKNGEQTCLTKCESYHFLATLLSVSTGKTGRWIKYGVPRCGEQHYKCTSCGYYINFGQWGELYTKEFIYCPHCKAKMGVKK